MSRACMRTCTHIITSLEHARNDRKYSPRIRKPHKHSRICHRCCCVCLRDFPAGHHTHKCHTHVSHIIFIFTLTDACRIASPPPNHPTLARTRAPSNGLFACAQRRHKHTRTHPSHRHRLDTEPQSHALYWQTRDARTIANASS